jgi:hypothetical protein
MVLGDSTLESPSNTKCECLVMDPFLSFLVLPPLLGALLLALPTKARILLCLDSL